MGASFMFALFCYSVYFTVINPPPTIFTMAIKVRETGIDSNGNTFIMPYIFETIRFRDGYIVPNPYWQTEAVFKGNHTFIIGSLYQIRYYLNSDGTYTLVMSQRVPS